MKKHNDTLDFGDWEPVIGLEIHVQLLTKTKMFSRASSHFCTHPNTQVSLIDLGLPGILPIPNEAAIHMAVKFGLSIDADIAERSVFARKNYFYPDLPKGYQITQDRQPIVKNGYLDIPLPNHMTKRIHIERAHLEEDAGKSIHDLFPNATGIDLNRAGNPLLEIVSAPEMSSASEAVAYLKMVHTLVRYLNICDGNMQEGSFRCDANVSVKPKGTTPLGVRAEIKNINSFRFVERAINYEIRRQIDVLENNGTLPLETRLYNPDKNETRSMRLKEQAHEYRYFPDPDLLPVHVSQNQIQKIQKTLPELPWEKQARLQSQYQLSDYDAQVLITDPLLANFYETVMKHTTAPAKLAANWTMGECLAMLNKSELGIETSPVTPKALAGLLNRIEDGSISGKMAKTVFAVMWEIQADADTIIKDKGLQQITDEDAITKIISEVIDAHPAQVAQYRSGKEQLLGFFVGQVMQRTKGQANPKQVNTQLLDQLKQAK